MHFQMHELLHSKRNFEKGEGRETGETWETLPILLKRSEDYPQKQTHRHTDTQTHTHTHTHTHTNRHTDTHTAHTQADIQTYFFPFFQMLKLFWILMVSFGLDSVWIDGPKYTFFNSCGSVLLINRVETTEDSIIDW